MSKNIQSIVETFYNGAWDLSERLCLLPQEIITPYSTITAQTITQSFQKSSQEFLDLTGSDIPREFHAEYNFIDETVRNEIMPSLEILIETWNNWDDLKGFNPEAYWQDQIAFAQNCAYIANNIDLQIIIPTAAIEKGLKRTYSL